MVPCFHMQIDFSKSAASVWFINSADKCKPLLFPSSGNKTPMLPLARLLLETRGIFNNLERLLIHPLPLILADEFNATICLMFRFFIVTM